MAIVEVPQVHGGGRGGSTVSRSPIPLQPGNNEAWIVDVDGVRLVLAAWLEEAPSDTVKSEVRQIVESIHFGALTRHGSAVLPRIEHAG